MNEHEETIAMIIRFATHQVGSHEKSSLEDCLPDVRLDTFPVVDYVAEGSVWTDPNSQRVYVFQHSVWRRSDQLCECCGIQLNYPEGLEIGDA